MSVSSAETEVARLRGLLQKKDEEIERLKALLNDRVVSLHHFTANLHALFVPGSEIGGKVNRCSACLETLQ